MAEKQKRGEASNLVSGAVSTLNSAGKKGFEWAVRSIGNAVAPVIGGLAGGTIGKAVYRLSKLVAQLIALEIMVNVILTFLAVVILILFSAFALFIINSGAYITPKSDPLQIGSGAGEEGTGSQAVLCFNFVNFPEAGLELELQASEIIRQAGNFTTDVCRGGEITITYYDEPPGLPCEGCGGRSSAYRNIQIFPAGLGGLGNTLYTLAHELGHEHSYVSTVDSAYFQSTALQIEGLVCTYPLYEGIDLNDRKIESYPELIALYIGGPNPPSGFQKARWSCLGGNLRQGMPLTWQFARDNIFKENLGW